MFIDLNQGPANRLWVGSRGMKVVLAHRDRSFHDMQQEYLLVGCHLREVGFVVATSIERAGVLAI